MRINPQKMDFYLAQQHQIADRIKYTLENGIWNKYHIAA